MEWYYHGFSTVKMSSFVRGGGGGRGGGGEDTQWLVVLLSGVNHQSTEHFQLLFFSSLKNFLLMRKRIACNTLLVNLPGIYIAEISVKLFFFKFFL